MSTRQEIIHALALVTQVGLPLGDEDAQTILEANGMPHRIADAEALWDEVNEEVQREKSPPPISSPLLLDALSWSTLVDHIVCATVAGARFSDSDLTEMLKANRLPWRLSDVQELRRAVKAATYPTPEGSQR